MVKLPYRSKFDCGVIIATLKFRQKFTDKVLLVLEHQLFNTFAYLQLTTVS
jgi:hypothetical protein